MLWVTRNICGLKVMIADACLLHMETFSRKPFHNRVLIPTFMKLTDQLTSVLALARPLC